MNCEEDCGGEGCRKRDGGKGGGRRRKRGDVGSGLCGEREGAERGRMEVKWETG